MARAISHEQSAVQKSWPKFLPRSEPAWATFRTALRSLAISDHIWSPAPYAYLEVRGRRGGDRGQDPQSGSQSVQRRPDGRRCRLTNPAAILPPSTSDAATGFAGPAERHPLAAG